MRLCLALLLLLSFASIGSAQQPAAPEEAPSTEEAMPEPQVGQIVVPAGTKVPLVIKHAVSTKSARVGDNVYLETTFPVVANNRVLIPAGTYVQGVISNVKRAGRIKGRAEILLHFTTLVYPNGYTVSMPGALENVPGAEKSKIKDEEGAIQAESERGKDVVDTIKTAGATGTAGVIMGGVTGGGKGARVGGGVGLATGLAIGLLRRGQDVRLENGSTVEMVFQRPLYLEEARLSANSPELVPVEKGRKLEKPVLTPSPN